MENNAEKTFTELKGDVSAYAGLKLRLLKLMAIERTAGILSALSHGLMLMLFTFFTLLFLFVALGFFLGDLLESIALGFLIVGGIYLILTLAFVMAKGRIRMQFMNIFVKALQTNEDDHDDNEKDQSAESTRTTTRRETENPDSMSGSRGES